MKGTIVSIHAEGMIERLDIDGPPELPALKVAIGGGYIEVVPGFERITLDDGEHACVAFCDEDGKRKQLPVNRIATAAWWKQLAVNPGGDVLVGDVAVVFGDAEFMEQL